jgi:3-oxoacyl-[acyl-carrier protein] reductase
VTADGKLEGRVALVTGASRRIGRATAILLAAEGAHVIVHARSAQDEIDAVAAAIRTAGGSATTALADVTDEAAVSSLVGGILQRHGRLDIVVNNAAIRTEAAFQDISLDDWRAVNSVVVEGAFLVTRAAIGAMAENRWGRIVSLGGVTAHNGVLNRVHVATAKAALSGFTKAIATEFAPDGITANLVVPGRIGGARSSTSGTGGTYAPGAAPIVPHEGTPMDVAETIRNVVLSPFVTGQTLHVSGGMYFP